MSNDFAVVPHVASELNRMLLRQKELDPSTPEYSTLLRNIELLAGTADLYIDIMDYLAQAGMQCEEDRITQVTVAPFVAQAIQERAEEETKTEAPENVVEFPPVDEPPFETDAAPESYTLVDVRAALRDAKLRGVNIKELVQSFGATNLTDLDPAKYGELMKKLEG